jgi:hypothetical protein
MWYKIAQTPTFQNLTETSSPSSIQTGASQGFITDTAGYSAVQKFIKDGVPTEIRDVNTGKMVTLAHGNLTNGQFQIVDQNGQGVTQDQYTQWAQANGFNSSNLLLSCYQGAANSGALKSLTSYRGKLMISTTSTPDQNGNYTVFVSGG